jgi:hypothetical protein
MKRHIVLLLCVSCLLLVTALWSHAANLPPEAVYGFNCMTAAGEGALSSYICNPTHLSVSNKTHLGVWHSGQTTQLAFMQPNLHGIAGGLYVTRWGGELYNAAYVVALGPWKGLSTNLTLRSAFDGSGPTTNLSWAGDLGLGYATSIFKAYSVYSSPYSKPIAIEYQPKLRLGVTVGTENVALALDSITYQHGEQRFSIGSRLSLLGITLKASGISAPYQAGMSLDELVESLSFTYAANINVGSLQIGATYMPQATGEQQWAGSIGWMW